MQSNSDKAFSLVCLFAYFVSPKALPATRGFGAEKMNVGKGRNPYLSL
jgi:hypothetical protein